MAKIIGELDIRDVANGGAEFKLDPSSIKSADHSDDEDCTKGEYETIIREHSLWNCLTNEDAMVNEEPFAVISNQMINVLRDGKIKKRIMKEGYGGKPYQSSNVKIHYNAYLESKPFPFDSTFARKKPLIYTIGEGGVIEGLEIAVCTMKLAEKAQFLLHPDVAYKDSGLLRIPANSTVLFEITLCEIFETTETEAQLKDNKDFKTVYKHGLAHCVKGKQMFRLKNFESAAKEYEAGLRKLEYAMLADYEEQMKSDELVLRFHTNLLICYTHLNRPKQGCYHANNIFDMAKDDTFKVEAKVYFNNAKCLRMLGDYSLADKRLNRAGKLLPNNQEILQEFVNLRIARQDYHEKLKKMASGLVNG